MDWHVIFKPPPSFRYCFSKLSSVNLGDLKQQSGFIVTNHVLQISLQQLIRLLSFKLSQDTLKGNLTDNSSIAFSLE